MMKVKCYLRQMVLNNVALDLSVQSFAVKWRIPTNYFTMREIKASENNNFWKRGNNFFLSLICFYFAIRFLMWIIESVDLKEHFVHQNFPIHLTIFFITTSRFSTTVLFWQNATLSNIWIGIAFFAIRNTNKIAWRTLTLFGGVRKGESCF